MKNVTTKTRKDQHKMEIGNRVRQWVLDTRMKQHTRTQLKGDSNRREALESTGGKIIHDNKGTSEEKD